MSDSAAWYLARGTGTVSLVLFTLVVALGILARAGVTIPGVPKFVVQQVHRNAALIATLLTALHVALVVYDPYVNIGLLDAVVPFGSDYRPVYVGLGTVVLDLLLVVVVTSLLRERIGRRVWKAVHLAAYAMWPIALLHGIGSGTDRSSTWMVVLDVACVAAVLGAALLHPALRNPVSANGAVTHRANQIGAVSHRANPAAPPARLSAPLPVLTDSAVKEYR